MTDFDIILAGGGLASGLLALRLALLRPDLRVAIVESGPSLGGNHTWSHFEDDLTAEQRAWTADLYAHRWPGYSVAFPKVRRDFAMGYASATSELLDAAVRAAVSAERILTSAPVVALDPTSVTLADQRTLTAGAVIDGRGQGPSGALDLRAQKFLGLEVETETPHGLTLPIIMDATVPQLDGYRFVYSLPFSPTRLLIEDTYYSDGVDLDPAALEKRLLAYAEARGWTVARIVRREHGVLPVALGGDIDAFWDEGEARVPRIGLRAAQFHPTTGYSFPDAVRMADAIAALPSFDAASIYAATRAASAAAWENRGYYRLLNRLLFLAGEPAERYKVLQRFYQLDPGLIARFYAGETTLADKARVLVGKPPVPFWRAVNIVLGGKG